MESIMQDVRIAARMLARAPTFAVAVIATLTLGIGASLATFGAVRAVLLQKLPYQDPDGLVLLTAESSVAIPDGVDWRDRTHTLADIALFLPTWDFDLTGLGAPERLNGAVAEPRLFRILGTRALLGRPLTDADDRAGGPHVVAIARSLWHRRFAADPTIVGQLVTLNGHPTTIVGVMPDGADVLGGDVELWVPQAVETPWAAANRGSNNFAAVGRLVPGVSLDAARADLRAISGELAAKYPDTNTGKIIAPARLLDALVGSTRAPLLLLLGAVTLALLLASANLAGLLLARAESRRDEIALRRALGAGRGRIVRQLLTEGLVLVLTGTTLGLALAAASRDPLVAIAAPWLPRTAEIAVDWSVVSFAAVIAVVTGTIFTVGPALALARESPASGVVGRGHRGGRSHRILRGLVAAELTAGLVLLTGAALLARSFVSLARANLGFDPTHVVTADLVLPESRYSDPSRQTRAFRDVVHAIAAAPGIDAAGSVIGLPLSTTGHIGHTLTVAGRPPAAGPEDDAADRPVTGDYFRALRLPIVHGRAFTDADREDAPPVAIVNQTLARRLWSDVSPLGARVRWTGIGDDVRWMTVVGVAGDVAGATPASPDAPALYMPYVQRSEAWQRFGSLVVRTRLDERATVAIIQAAVARVDPDVPLAHVGTMTTRRADTIARPRFLGLALGVFALAALILAVQGVYGTVSYVVERRRREFGVRVAVGATAGDVIRLVLRDAAVLSLAGITLGSIIAVLVTRLLGGLLYGVGPNDPLTHVAAAVALAAATLGGAYVPARRAARADPLTSLRQD